MLIRSIAACASVQNKHKYIRMIGECCSCFTLMWFMLMSLLAWILGMQLWERISHDSADAVLVAWLWVKGQSFVIWILWQYPLHKLLHNKSKADFEKKFPGKVCVSMDNTRKALIEGYEIVPEEGADQEKLVEVEDNSAAEQEQAAQQQQAAIAAQQH